MVPWGTHKLLCINHSPSLDISTAYGAIFDSFHHICWACDKPPGHLLPETSQVCVSELQQL